MMQVPRVLAILTTIVQKPHLRSTSILGVLYQLLEQSNHNSLSKQPQICTIDRWILHYRDCRRCLKMGRQLGVNCTLTN